MSNVGSSPPGVYRLGVMAHTCIHLGNGGRKIRSFKPYLATYHAQGNLGCLRDTGSKVNLGKERKKIDKIFVESI